MEKVRLGRTELYVTKTSFGALPIQRISKTDAVRLVRQAYEAGINYFDTANMYTDSEEKLGAALHDVRQHVVISTKSGATDKKTALEHMELSLRRLRTDYIDLFQFHNPAVLPDIDDPNGAFAAALEMREKGYIRHIGIRTIGWLWRGRRLHLVNLRRYNSLFVIWPRIRIWSWCACAGNTIWALSP